MAFIWKLKSNINFLVMKTLRLVGMALFAVLMCVNFAACSKEELPQYDLTIGEKKLTRIEAKGYNDSSVWDFSYDSEGKLLEVTFTKGGKQVRKSKYVWESNAIRRVNEDNERKYTLRNGLIQGWGGQFEITYRDTGRPKQFENRTFLWNDNGGLSRVSDELYNTSGNKIYDSRSFFYNENVKNCKGFNPMVPLELSSYAAITGDIEDLFIVHPELVGMHTTQLPVRYQDIDIYSGNSYGNISYSLDSEGYIYSCIISDGYSPKYIMTWK